MIEVEAGVKLQAIRGAEGDRKRGVERGFTVPGMCNAGARRASRDGTWRGAVSLLNARSRSDGILQVTGRDGAVRVVDRDSA
jgi:hypothetical protein